MGVSALPPAAIDGVNVAADAQKSATSLARPPKDGTKWESRIWCCRGHRRWSPSRGRISARLGNQLSWRSGGVRWVDRSGAQERGRDDSHDEG